MYLQGDRTRSTRRHTRRIRQRVAHVPTAGSEPPEGRLQLFLWIALVPRDARIRRRLLRHWIVHRELLIDGARERGGDPLLPAGRDARQGGRAERWSLLCHRGIPRRLHARDLLLSPPQEADLSLQPSNDSSTLDSPQASAVPYWIRRRPSINPHSTSPPIRPRSLRHHPSPPSSIVQAEYRYRQIDIPLHRQTRRDSRVPLLPLWIPFLRRYNRQD